MATLKDFIKSIARTAPIIGPSIGAFDTANSFLRRRKNNANINAPKQNTKIETASVNNAATSPDPVQIKPASNTPTNTQSFNNNTNTQLSSQGKQFAQTLLPSTPPASISDFNKSNNTQNNTNNTQTTNNDTQSDPFVSYLESLTNQGSLKDAFDTQNKDLQRLNEIRGTIDETSLDFRRQQEDALDAEGGTTAGARASASAIGARGNRELADLAIQESAAARTAGVSSNIFEQMLNAGATLQEARAAQQGESFTLGKDQVRFDSEGNIIAQGSGVGSGNNFGTSPQVQSFANAIRNNTAKLSDVPQDLRGQVLLAIENNPQDTLTPVQERMIGQANTALDVFDQIFENPALTRGAANRAIFGTKLTPGTDSRDLRSAIGSIQALVGFDELQKMRDASPTGGALGQVSEREIDFLQSLQGSIDTSQSDEQLINNLQRIQKSFQILQLVNSTNGSTGIIDGLEFIRQGDNLLTEADGDVYRLNERGNLELFSDFNNVGSDTNKALNLPQRNNNPGNIKAGGIGDQFAIGKDSQGHLIFPNAQAGFEAMKLDVQAKVNGNSRYLNANPTIAELGKVYAEDPNWGNAVARIVGVSPQTRTATIPINTLVQAIARQEGFYA